MPAGRPSEWTMPFPRTGLLGRFAGGKTLALYRECKTLALYRECAGEAEFRYKVKADRRRIPDTTP